MKTRNRHRIGLLAVVIALLVSMTGCDASASRAGCKGTQQGAVYTIEIKNNDNDATITVQLIVGSESKFAGARRHGTEVKVAAGKTVSKTVTVTKAQKTRDVRVFWPGPKGNDTFIYSEVLSSSCS